MQHYRLVLIVVAFMLYSSETYGAQEFDRAVDSEIKRAQWHVWIQ